MSELLKKLLSEYGKIRYMYHIPFSKKLYKEEHYIYLKYNELVNEMLEIIKEQEEKLEKVKLIQTNYLPDDVEMVLMSKKEFDKYTKFDMQNFINNT